MVTANIGYFYLPGQGGGEGVDEVEEGPGHDDVVVGGQQEGHDHGGQTRAYHKISLYFWRVVVFQGITD